MKAKLKDYKTLVCQLVQEGWIIQKNPYLSHPKIHKDIAVKTLDLAGEEINVWKSKESYSDKYVAGELWFNKSWFEWIEPDYNNWEVDKPIEVSNDEIKWLPRHFSCIQNGKIFTWPCGCTSWSSESRKEVDWEYAREPEV